MVLVFFYLKVHIAQHAFKQAEAYFKFKIRGEIKSQHSNQTRCGSRNKVYLTKYHDDDDDYFRGTNLNDIPVLNYCSKQLFVFRVILLFLQVSCMLEGKNEIQIKTVNLTPTIGSIVH